MIVPDANLLLYAGDSTSPFHRAAAVARFPQVRWYNPLTGRRG